MEFDSHASSGRKQHRPTMKEEARVTCRSHLRTSESASSPAPRACSAATTCIVTSGHAHTLAGPTCWHELPDTTDAARYTTNPADKRTCQAHLTRLQSCEGPARRLGRGGPQAHEASWKKSMMCTLRCQGCAWGARQRRMDMSASLTARDNHIEADGTETW